MSGIDTIKVPVERYGLIGDNIYGKRRSVM